MAVNYSTELCAMEEPPLSEIDAEESFRVLWIPSIESTLMVRLSRIGDRYLLEAVRLSPQGSETPRAIIARESRSLSEQAWQEAVEVVRRSGFERMSASPPLPTGPTMVTFDDENWVLEAQRNGTYKIVQGSNSIAPDQFRAACLYFFGLSGLEPEVIEWPEVIE